MVEYRVRKSPTVFGDARPALLLHRLLAFGPEAGSAMTMRSSAAASDLEPNVQIEMMR
jgi:hypothetical protein